jgi:imidazolonepropionase-like amidohydrolase
MLDRGFTTVRDAGGADWGIKAAVEAGLIPGPRLFISNRSIGPTGGHNDRNRRTQSVADCGCCNAMVFIRAIADGPDEVRKAAREQLRQGADQVKFMVSGGVASPYDPLESRQLTVEELSAGVDEAKAFGRYALAHAYTPEAITRAMIAGVRTIEHGNLVDAKAAKLMASKGAYMVPNLVAYVVMKERAANYGMTRDMLDKNEHVLKSGYAELELCQRAGVKMGYGSDLLGALENEQSREFLIRREVMAPIEVLRSATLVGAEIVREQGRLGVIEPGAHADLLLVEGDPLRDFACLQDGGAHIPVIMKAGRFHKYALA